MSTRCRRLATLLLTAALTPSALLAQKANDLATQQAILAALPAGVAAEQATADEIAQAATDLVFGIEGPLEANITQVMVSLGELAQAGRFKAAPRFGDGNPTGRFYTKIMNLASSNLDVSSSTYYSITVQDMTRLAAAARAGQNFLHGATSNPITRK